MRVLNIPDLHSPYQHPDSEDFLIDTYRRFKCDTIVSTGDDIDFHGLSQYQIDPECESTNTELENAGKYLNYLDRLFTKRIGYNKQVLVCIGNHYDRLEKACIRAGLPVRLLKKVKTEYKFPKRWKWKPSFRIDNVVYTHGTQLTGVHAFTHAVYRWQANIVYGHLHHDAGIRYVHTLSGKQFWAMNSGCLINPEHAAFRYDKRSGTKPVLACSVILDGFPILVPMGSKCTIKSY